MLTGWCWKAWESCSQLSAMRVWYRLMCRGLPSRRGGNRYPRPAPCPLRLRGLGCGSFKAAKPDRRRQGAPYDAGVRERPTDPPLKRRSARERGARSNRAPGAAAVRWCTAVAHNDRAPGSSPGAATIYARQADRVIWRGAVDADSAVRVRGLVHRRDVMAALRPPKPPVGVQVPAPVPFLLWT